MLIPRSTLIEQTRGFGFLSFDHADGEYSDYETDQLHP